MGQGESLLANGHLMFLHRFEQGTLHLGRCTVDFVGQHEVGEYRTLLHLEVLSLLRVDHRTDDIGRQKVGSELDAAVLRVNQLRQRLDGQRLCQSGNAFQQDVPIT